MNVWAYFIRINLDLLLFEWCLSIIRFIWTFIIDVKLADFISWACYSVQMFGRIIKYSKLLNILFMVRMTIEAFFITYHFELLTSYLYGFWNMSVMYRKRLLSLLWDKVSLKIIKWFQTMMSNGRLTIVWVKILNLVSLR